MATDSTKTEVSGERSEGIGRQLERFREVLMRVTGGAAVDSPIPTKIYVFRSESSFRPYKTRLFSSSDSFGAKSSS